MSQAATEHAWAWPRAVEMYRDGVDIALIWPVLEQARDEVEMLSEMVVQRAVKHETWKTIGAVLGVSRQYAAKKYGPRA